MKIFICSMCGKQDSQDKAVEISTQLPPTIVQIGLGREGVTLTTYLCFECAKRVFERALKAMQGDGAKRRQL